MSKIQFQIKHIKKIDTISIERGIITVRYTGGYIATHVANDVTGGLFDVLLDTILNNYGQEVPDTFKEAVILNIFEQEIRK